MLAVNTGQRSRARIYSADLLRRKQISVITDANTQALLPSGLQARLCCAVGLFASLLYSVSNKLSLQCLMRKGLTLS